MFPKVVPLEKPSIDVEVTLWQCQPTFVHHGQVLPKNFSRIIYLYHGSNSGSRYCLLHFMVEGTEAQRG